MDFRDLDLVDEKDERERGGGINRDSEEVEFDSSSSTFLARTTLCFRRRVKNFFAELDLCFDVFEAVSVYTVSAGALSECDCLLL